MRNGFCATASSLLFKNLSTARVNSSLLTSSSSCCCCCCLCFCGRVMLCSWMLRASRFADFFAQRLFLQTKGAERQQGPQTRRRDVAYDLTPPVVGEVGGADGDGDKDGGGRKGRRRSVANAGAKGTRGSRGSKGQGGAGGGADTDDTHVMSIEAFKAEQRANMEKYLARDQKKKEMTEAEFRANFPDAPKIDLKNITILHRFTLRPDEMPTPPQQTKLQSLASHSEEPSV